MDGLTTTLKAKAKVTPCQPYHLRLAIADVADGAYDSYVFVGGLDLGDDTLKYIEGDTSTCIGKDAVLKLNTTTSVISQKWQTYDSLSSSWVNLMDGTQYSGVTTKNLTVINPQSSLNNKKYRVELITSNCGKIYSTEAVLKVGTTLVNYSSPQSITECILQGKSYTFTSIPSIASSSFVSYIWQVKTPANNSFVNLSANSIYSGVTANTLVISNADSTLSGNQYQLKVLDISGCYNGNSSSALLTLNTIPSVNVISNQTLCLVLK